MRDIETRKPNKLFGIFGDAQWTNKERLSDAMLRDLVEHFSLYGLLRFASLFRFDVSGSSNAVAPIYPACDEVLNNLGP
jgi:hypothetical protein